jgi:hypothetical protein
MVAGGSLTGRPNGASYLKDYHWQMQSARLLLLDSH